MGPETTRIGPDSVVRHAPTVMRLIPLRPVGNSAACQPVKRSAVSGASKFRVASSIISTMAIDLSSGLGEARDIEPELASDRRADLFGVEVFSFDGRGIDDLISESGEAGLSAKLETQGLHLPEVSALLVPHGGKNAGQGSVIPGEIWPAS